MVPSLETHASWFSKNWLLGGPWGIGFVGGNSLVMVAKELVLWALLRAWVRDS